MITNNYCQLLSDVKLSIGNTNKHCLSDKNGYCYFKDIIISVCTIDTQKEKFIDQFTITAVSVNKIKIILLTGKTYLNVSDSLINASLTKVKYKIKVSSNATWVVSEKYSWIETSTLQGEGNKEFEITLNENAESDIRTAEILVETSSITLDGRVIKSIPIHSETDDHPQYPEIYPYDIGFTSNGCGRRCKIYR